MPSPYAAAGIIGGVFALGYLIYTIWTQNHPQLEEPRRKSPRSEFNPEAGYDRPRDTNSNWGDEDDGYSRRRRRVEECPICTENIQISNRRCLPCNHVFHDSCITLWFRQRRTCPTCRNPA